jgi:hypothetical protein
MTATPGPGGDPAPAPAPRPPVETKPLNAVALAREVVLDRLEHLLSWLLHRLQRYRAKRGDWWEK